MEYSATFKKVYYYHIVIKAKDDEAVQEKVDELLDNLSEKEEAQWDREAMCEGWELEEIEEE